MKCVIDVNQSKQFHYTLEIPFYAIIQGKYVQDSTKS